MWMQDISSNLDPEQFKKLEKFRKVGSNNSKIHNIQ